MSEQTAPKDAPRQQVEADLKEFALAHGWSPAQVNAALERVSQRPAPALVSPEIDQLFAALAMAKGSMFSPVRNKHVTVTRKKGGTYDFRYATLDVINDMARLPLFENGLIIMHLMRTNRRGELFMATRLAHRSGQFIDSVLPIVAGPSFDDDAIGGPQKLGSLMTFAKRYNICALLDIAGQEDDDANVAEGNMIIDHEYPVEPNAQARVLQDRYARLISAAANARDPAGIGEMLLRWQKGMEFWLRMREDVDHRENWDRLITVIPEAIRRVHDPLLADIFRDSAAAVDKPAIDDVRKLWDTEPCKAARSKMKALNPISYGMLFEHLRMQAARVEREGEEAARRRAQDDETAAMIQSLEDEGSPFDVATPLKVSYQADLSYRHVRDEFGEIASDLCDLPSEWARIYAALWSSADNRQALQEHNEEGLAWIELDIGARVVVSDAKDADIRLAKAATVEPVTQQLDPAMYPAGQSGQAVALRVVQDQEAYGVAPDEVDLREVVIGASPAAAEPTIATDERQLTLLPDASEFDAIPLHKTGRGTPDLTRYVGAVRISLNRAEAADLPAWEAANLSTVDTLPQSTQMTLCGLLAARKQALGVSA